jgi:outer membrane receptor protein involved in Fe transport
MKSKIAICLLFTFFTLFSQAQNETSSSTKPGSISGKVIDKKTNEAIPYVTISIIDDGKIITGGISQDNGNFTVKNIPLKTVAAEIIFIGYKKQTLSINLSNSDKSVNLKTIYLEEESTQLEEVQIVKDKSIIEQKIDRKVINVGKDLISAGATAGEIMNNIPSVSVDPQTNAISLRGNENVRILVDGKPTNVSAAQLLQQIPSASIKQIELITNPSAKYNPEGMSGIINIVLHKNAKLGFNGSINNGVTFAITPKVNSSVDMNYRSGRFNFYGNYGFNHGKYANYGFINILDINNTSNQLFDFGNKNSSHLGKIGLDFYINDRNTISFYTNQSRFDGDGFGKTDVDYTTGSNPDILQLFINDNSNTTQTYNLDYKHNFKKEGENIELEINYNLNDGRELAYFSYPELNSAFSNQVKTLGDNTIINLDYVNPLSDKTKLELGLESRVEATDNSFDITNNYDSDFDFKRTIHSAYVTYGKQFEKWSYQLGSRFEQYNVDSQFRKLDSEDINLNGNTNEILTQKYEDEIFAIYPSAYLTYTPTEKNAFNLNFSRRVDRPSIGQVNPIREWSTPTVTSVGEPSLVPQFTNSFELNYTRKTKIGSITSGVFYRMIEDEITRSVYTDPLDENRQILTYLNFDNNNAYGVEVSGNLDFTKWWSANISFDAYYRKVKGAVENEQNVIESSTVDATLFNSRINNNFKITKNLRAQWFGMYRGQDKSLQYTRKAMWKTDIGASLTVLKGNGTVSARFSDIFKSMNFQFEGSKPTPREGEFNWESRSVYLGFNYKFGSGKNRALQRKQRDNNETQGGGGMF